jgi:hypothetical protein
MTTTTPLKVLATALMVLLFSFSFAQRHADGGSLSMYLGKSSESQEFKNFVKDNNFEMANESHYLSKNGIELILKNGILDQISLYKSSSVYGNYTGKLPHDLVFNMTSANVKQLLGKPKVAYTSGYAEFDLIDCTIACWFDGDRLSQVSLNKNGTD